MASHRKEPRSPQKLPLAFPRLQASSSPVSKRCRTSSNDKIPLQTLRINSHRAATAPAASNYASPTAVECDVGGKGDAAEPDEPFGAVQGHAGQLRKQMLVADTPTSVTTVNSRMPSHDLSVMPPLDPRKPHPSQAWSPCRQASRGSFPAFTGTELPPANQAVLSSPPASLDTAPPDDSRSISLLLQHERSAEFENRFKQQQADRNVLQAEMMAHIKELTRANTALSKRVAELESRPRSPQ